MNCKYCGNELKAGAKFCVYCGKEVKKANKFCVHCGKELPEGVDFCIYCGEKVKKEANEEHSLSNESEMVTVKLEPSDEDEMRTVYIDDHSKETTDVVIPGYGSDQSTASGYGNGSSKKLIIILGCIIAALIVVMGILLFQIFRSLSIAGSNSAEVTEETSEETDTEEEDSEEEAEGAEASEETKDSKEDEGDSASSAENQDDPERSGMDGSDDDDSFSDFSNDSVDIGVIEEDQQDEKSVLEEGIHEYEVIIADVSWSEAFQRCLDRGGHLVCFNSPEEYDYVLGLINDMNIDNNRYNLFIGGKRGEGDDYFWVDENGQCVGEGLTESCKNYWLPGEPSLRDESVNVDEYCMDMLYKKKEGRWYWNDVTDDPIGLSDYFSGRMGYICEYQ